VDEVEGRRFGAEEVAHELGVDVMHRHALRCEERSREWVVEKTDNAAGVEGGELF